MFKLGVFLLALLAIFAAADARPGVVAAAYTGVPVAAPVAYTAPGFVTATSAQYVARNYNGVFAAPYVAAAAPVVTSAAYSYAPAFVY